MVVFKFIIKLLPKYIIRNNQWVNPSFQLVKAGY